MKNRSKYTAILLVAGLSLTLSMSFTAPAIAAGGGDAPRCSGDIQNVIRYDALGAAAAALGYTGAASAFYDIASGFAEQMGSDCAQ